MMKTMIFFKTIALAIAVFFTAGVIAQTNPTAQSLNYSQDFSTFNGSQTTYPAGIQGWTISGSTSTSFPTAAPNGNQNLSAGTNASTSAAVYDMNGKIGILCTGSALRAIAVSISTTGKSNISVSYTAATQRQEVGARIGAIGLQYRIGTSGTFTNVASSEYQNPGGSNNTSGTTSLSAQNISVSLPTACENEAVVQLRWVYREVSGSGNRPSFSVDNISITGVLPSSVNNPTNFAAAANEHDQIDLSWTLNANDDDVLLAWSANGTFGAPSGTYNIGDPITGGGTVLYAGASPSLSHTGLNAQTTYYYKIWSYNGTDYSSGVTGNATTEEEIFPEPANHVTNFSASILGNSVTLTWTDEATAAGYLIKMSDVDYTSIVAPADVTPEADAAGIKNVAQGVQTCTFTGLNFATTYYFKIFPYSNAGANINYKTDGSVPQDDEITPPAPTTLADFKFEYNLDPEVGAIGAPQLISSAAIDYFSGVTGEAACFSSASNKYFELTIATTGYKDISLSWAARRSSALGGKWQVTVAPDGATFGTVIYSGDLTETFTLHSLLLDAACNNKENIKVRFTAISGYSGTLRLDDLNISAYAITDATYNTITLDGVNSGWNAGDVFTNITSADYAHFTWDQDFLYFAIADVEADYGNMATFMYMNSNPADPTNGTTDVYTWGQNIYVPFKANLVMVWKNEAGNDYLEVKKWDGSAWITLGSFNGNNYMGMVHFEVGTDYREIKISRNILGIASPGAELKIASITEQQWGTNWRYFGWPSEGWIDGNRSAGQKLTHCYTYKLDEFIYPNDAQYLTRDMYLTSNTTINTDETYNDFFVEPGIELTIDPSATVTVNGNFYILSDASGTGSVITNGTLQVNGSTNVHKFLPNTTVTGWSLASPIYHPGHFVITNNADAAYYYDAQNAQWAPITSSLAPMQGYTAKYSSGDVTLNFTGNVLNNGTQTPPASFVRTGVSSGNFGWNLTGNPYPSPIDWDLVVGNNNAAFVTSSQLNAAIHIRRANGSVMTYLPNMVPNDPNRIIPAMQAFWVQVNSAYTSGTFSLFNMHRVHASNNLLKSSSVADMLEINATRDGSDYDDVARIFFRDGATDLFDGAYDAAKLFSENDDHVQIYTFDAANDVLAYNTMPEITSAKSLNLGFKTQIAGNFTLNFNALGLPSDISVTLEDRNTNTFTDVRLQSAYTFYAAEMESNDRFVLHFNLLATSIDNEVAITSHIYANDNAIYITDINNDNALVTVLNMVGQEVYSGILNKSSLAKVNVDLATGQYIVRLISAGTTVSEKVYIK